MGLRIWHQSFTVLQDLPEYREALRKRIAAVVRPDTEVVLHGQIPGTYPSDYPGTDLKYRFLYWMHGLQWVAAAREAERQGFDAMVMANIPSPMIAEIRTLVEIPVVAYGEAAFHVSGLYGRKVGMLFFTTERRDFWPERMHDWGVSERFAGIMGAGVTFRDVADALANPDRRKSVCETIVAHGKRLVEECGADVIVPGEMPLNLLLALEGINYIAGATVIDGISLCFKMAETMIDLKNFSGMGPSRRGYFHDKPDPKRVDQVFSFYGLEGLGSRIVED